MKIQLSKPQYVTLVVPEELGTTEVKIDIFEARRMLVEANKQPNEQLKWKHIREWLASKLGVPNEMLAESNALEFNNMVLRVADKFVENLSKNIEGMLYSQQPTQASPETT